MKRLYFVLALAVAAVLLAACSGGTSTATISGADLGKGYDDSALKVTDPTTTFRTTDVFHCVITVSNAQDGTRVRTVWTAVDTTDESGTPYVDTQIDEATFTTNNTSSVINATLTPSTGSVWPVGKYKIDIYLNDKLDRTLDFTVQ